MMGAKVFTATKAKDRDELGEVLTRWIQDNPKRDHRQGRDPELRPRVPLPQHHDLLRSAARAVSAAASHDNRATPG